MSEKLAKPDYAGSRRQTACESSRMFCCVSPMKGSCKGCCEVMAGEWGILLAWSFSPEAFGDKVCPTGRIMTEATDQLILFLGLGFNHYPKFQYPFKAAAELCKKVSTEGRVD